MNPDKGYRSDYLYLPRKKIAPFMSDSIKRSLTFEDQGRATIQAWRESETHLIIPRERLIPQQILHLHFEIEDLSPKSFPRVNVGLTYELRDWIQKTGKRSLVRGGNGVLSLSCGKGKTVIALHAWAELGVPALVIVPTKDLAWQWKSRIIEHTSMEEDDVGFLSGSIDTWDWKKPISVATVHAVARASEEITDEMKRHWGVAIYDEVHRLGAPYFNRAASVCAGNRWGLSATPFRRDGLDVLYQSHIGGLLYQNLEHENIPTVYFVETGTRPTAAEERKLRDRSGEISIPKLYTWLANNDRRNQILNTIILRVREDSRISLVLTERVSHLEEMSAVFPSAGVIHGRVKGEQREAALQNHDIVLAITQLARDGLDRSDLNTVIISMPFTDRGRFEQVIGRAQRSENPTVIILEDDIEVCHKMCARLRTHLRSLKYPFRTIDRRRYGE
jgi:superfamily II DNA or RNA helicase